MTGVMMAQAGVGAAAQDTGGLLLNNNAAFSIIVGPTSFLPLASFRAKTDGVAAKAGGSTAAFLTYIDLPLDQWHTGHPITGADYEIYFDSVTNSMTGSAGTWFGDTRDAWLGLGSQRTWTLQKDTSSFGNTQHVILIEVRNIATPAQTTGAATWTFTVGVDL